MNDEAMRFAVIWQTLLALVIAGIAWLVGLVLSGLFIFYSQRLWTNTRPEVIGFFSSVGSGFFGVLAARWACDKLLRHYSQKAVFFLFVLYCVATTWVQVLMPMHWSQISVYAQNIAIALAAFSLFWKGEDTGFESSHPPVP